VSKWLTPRFEHGKITCLSNIDAAIAIRQFEKLDKLLAERVKRKKNLDDLLDNKISGENPLCQPLNMTAQNSGSVATKYLIKTKVPMAGIRDSYQHYFGKSGIEMQSLYTPIHFQKPYKTVPIHLPLTEELWDRILHVPVEPAMNEREFNYVVNQFAGFCKFINGERHAAT
jgi:dTDP-4-amino-4,6-dideoxygalactose transaminase